MKMPSIYQQQRETMEVAMTPMIDVVFLLLVFFVWTASFQIVEYALPSQLSAKQGSQPTEMTDTPPPEDDFDDVVVRILWENRPVWRLNDARVGSIRELRTRLKEIADIKNDAPVIIHPDGDVPLGDLVDVYDVSLQVGFQKVQFAATEEI